jgi:uncharacterized protein
MTQPPADILTLCGAALLIGLAKGGLGGPLPPLFATLLLSERSTVAAAVVVATPMLLTGDGFALWTYWRRWNLTQIRMLLPAGVAGVAVGLLLLRGLPDRALRVSLGVAGLVVVLYKIHAQWRGHEHYVRRVWHGPLAGLLGGATSAMLNAGGPPVISYLLLQGLTPITFTATNTLFFSVVNVFKVPGSLAMGVIEAPALLWSVLVCPIVACGVFAGRWFVLRVNPIAFDRFMTGILVLACLWLIVVP